MSYLIDTHCHFDFEVFDASREHIWQTCLAENIRALFIPSVKAAAFEKTLIVCQSHSKWFPMLGLHPYFLSEHKDADLATLESYLQQYEKEIIAVGEIGLDFYEGRETKERQIQLFQEQLKLAKYFKKPVVIHSRKANDDVLKVLNDVRFEQGGIIHAFSGSKQQADRFIEKGFMLGFGGAMTFERATNLRELVKTLPIESICFETDAPDMSPSFLDKGEHNSPHHLSRIVKEIAQLRGESYDVLVETHFEQIKTLFSLEL